MPGLCLERASICDDPDCLDDLAPAWNELLRHAFDDRLFLTPLWQRTWWRHFGDGHRLFVATVGDLDSLVTLYRDGDTLRFVGGTEVSDYLDGVARAENADDLLAEAWQAVFDRSGPARFDLIRIPDGSPTLSVVPRVAARHASTLSCRVEQYLPCPALKLPDSWDAYLGGLRKKDRHELRRKLRHAGATESGAPAAGTWRVTQTHSELTADLATFFRLHRLSSANKERFLTAPMEAFFANITAKLLDARALRLAIFSHDGRPVAATLSFVYRGRYMLYNSGYDPDAREFSPGIAAAAFAIQDAINLGCTIFDFLSGDERYKYQLGASDHWTYRIVVERG